MSEVSTASDGNGVIYEVNASINHDDKSHYMEWLRKHIQTMLSFDGFESASILQPDHDEGTDRFHCTVHYMLESMESLQNYLDDHAPQMRAEGIELFGTQLITTRRILNSTEEFCSPDEGLAPELHDPDGSNALCLDCESALRGQYCHVCGQRDQRKLVSLKELVGDLFREILDWDSRFWRTLWPLLAKPGFLTQSYLSGQRMRYSPPLRMYLITSIVFFVTATIQPQMALMDLDVSEPLVISYEGMNFTISGTAVPQTDPDESATADKDASSVEEDAPDSRQKTVRQCEQILSSNWNFGGEFLKQRAYRSCLSLTTRAGLRDFGIQLLDNLPKTLFLLLPLMAFVNKLMYLFSRRYYVEHVLYYVHSYSFVFLFFTLLIILQLITEKLSVPYFGWVIAAAIIYTVYYFLRSMRVVYQQSRKMTVLKWLVIMVAFLILALMILTLLALFTAALVP